VPRAILRILVSQFLFCCVFVPAMCDAKPGGGDYYVRFDHWTDADERDYGEFVAAIGDSDCTTVNACLKIAANPFRNSDPPNVVFTSDCANLPYILRAYFAWKRGLPFSYERAVDSRGIAADTRYSRDGNRVTGRVDVLSGSTNGYALLEALLDATSSASYRIHPDLDAPLRPDLYSAAIQTKSIRPGTIIYDPNGHVAQIFRVESDGRVQYFDAHPDNSITRGYYDLRFIRAPPGEGAGFKNWRPLKLVGYRQGSDGSLLGGHIELAANAEISDFSDEQYFGNGVRPNDDNWSDGGFTLNGEKLDYYDYVRARLAGGKLQFDPVKETGEMVDSNCNDLHYRAQAVDLAVSAGIENRSEPDRLPRNIYGTEGDWEIYSTPSRDARLKTAFKELRDKAQRFVEMYQRADDTHLLYSGSDLVGDMLDAYDREAGKCTLTYLRSDGVPVTLSYEEARKRLFLFSFDPYQCIERRWGASDAGELSSCRDDNLKSAWYGAEQNLRNQIDRTYDAQMNFSLPELKEPGPGKGVMSPPETDARGYLVSMHGSVVARQVVAPQVVALRGPVDDVPVQPALPTENPADWLAAQKSRFDHWQSDRQGGNTRVASANLVELPANGSAQSSSPTAVSRTDIWDRPDAPEMVIVPPGAYLMGSPGYEAGRRSSEGPQHRVVIGRAFALSKYLVTFNEWDACVADGGCASYRPGDENWGRGDHPVINVSWRDAQAYVTWLSVKTGMHYSLPSETEWEYAARAGTMTPFALGNALSTAQANYDGEASGGTYRERTTEVGQFAANNFGLFDMNGNAWEWLDDCWNENYRAPHMPGDGEPMLAGDCERRVVRGGAFNSSWDFVRSASRFWEVGELRSALIGFRVARDL
jgi:formylglycine-generating enzyme required for sulfatase activity